MTEQDFVSRWDESYKRGENSILEPYEELVKFLNRFVVTRTAETGKTGLKEAFGSATIATTRVVDLGCGVGAQSEYLARMGFECHGFDVSEVAISAAINRTEKMENAPQFNTCTTESINLPEHFHIAIACASLDSMSFNEASKYLVHLKKAANSCALFFGTFIGSSQNGTAEEKIVTDTHEFGTVQSYFNLHRIEQLLGIGSVEILRLDRTSSVNVVPGINGRAPDRFIVVGMFSK